MWPKREDGGLRMYTNPLDLRDLLAELESSVARMSDAKSGYECPARMPFPGFAALNPATPLLPDRLRHRPARQHADQVRAVFGAAVDVGVHAVGRDGQAFEGFRREALLQRLLERGTRNTPLEPAPVTATRISLPRFDTNTPTRAKREAWLRNFW